MNSEEAKILLQRYRMGLCTPEEEEMIRQWYDELAADGEWAWTPAQKVGFETSLREGIGQVMRAERVKKVRMRYTRIAAAAAVFLAVCFGGYLFYQGRQPAVPVVAKAPVSPDIAPGGNKAVLVLADGTQVPLDSAANGRLARQGNAQVVKTGNGALVYKNAPVDGTTAPVVYNTLRTPVGGQYHISLPDGTTAWLNAASSLKYPTAFPGKERTVDITGEVYFEVAKDAAKPFHVRIHTLAGRQCEVEVLGTRFDINAYDDENAVKATLVEGSIRLISAVGNHTLLPGEQAVVENDEVHILSANVEEVTAWKNGLFVFKGEDIHTIMRQVARWYDLDVVFNNPPDEKFYVEVSRSTRLSSLLKMLEATGAVHFKLEGNKITVTK